MNKINKNKIKEVAGNVISAVEEATDEEGEKKIWDKVLDLIEEFVKETPTRIDDLLMLPLIRLFRNRYRIKDGD